MRRLIIFVFVLVISVWVGIEIIKHPGYLLLVYQPWMIQMPVWFALISLILLFGLFYILIDSIDRLQFLWFRLKNWLSFRRERRAYNKTQHGLIMLLECQWKSAERLLLAGVNNSIEPLMNYLGAAKAAHEQGAYDKRDRYIQTAYNIAPDADLAIGLTQAELELSQNQLEHAIATLNHLRQSSPYHPHVLTLLEKAYVRLGDWQHLLALLPYLCKAKILNREQVLQFEKNVYSEILNAAQAKNLDDIHLIWNNIPKKTKHHPDVVYAYVKQLLRFPQTTAEIEELIRKTLKHTCQSDLVIIYGTLPTPNQTDLNKRLVIAGAWLNIYGSKPEILLTLGRLCVQAKLWGKAKDYFEKSLKIAPDPCVSLEYGKLFELLGEPNEALQKYKEGLETVCNSLVTYDFYEVKRRRAEPDEP